jgi:hypothetical protein
VNSLCITTELNSSEMASWVQAIGSILAILFAAGIAIWQSRAQHRSALLTLRAEQRHAGLEAAKTLFALSFNCSKAARYFADQLKSRDAIYEVARGERHFDFAELVALRDAASGIPLHQLPDVLVSPAMALAATMRQLRQTIDIALTKHSSMDGEDFTRLFLTLKEMVVSLTGTTEDIGIEVDKQKNPQELAA